MKDDFAKATASPSAARVNGREYLVGKLTPRDVGDLQAFLKDAIPNPKDEAKRLMQGLPDTVALAIWNDAVIEAKSWPPTISDARGYQLLTTTHEGNARLLWVLLRKHNPGVSLEVSREIAEVISLEEIQEVIALGTPELAKAPKAEAAEMVETG